MTFSSGQALDGFVRGLPGIEREALDLSSEWKPAAAFTSSLLRHLELAFPIRRDDPHGVVHVRDEFEMTEEDDVKAAAGFHSLDEIKRFALDSWKSADKAVQSLPDEEGHGHGEDAVGPYLPRLRLVQIIYDEHLHHRGQLFAFLRQLGVEPPFLWDFENNAPEFRPAVPASQA